MTKVNVVHGQAVARTCENTFMALVKEDKKILIILFRLLNQQ